MNDLKDKKLLEIKNLTIDFFTDDGKISAVEDVAFEINQGEIVGLAGESGCGKSVAALSVLRLIPQPAGKISGGEILFKNKDILKLSIDELRKIRGAEISMIFQEPMTSLSPLQKIGKQLIEGLKIHNPGINKKEADEIAKLWLNKVGIHNADKRMESFPFELSGGMRQRVMIAMAMLMKPSLLIADEPTTALDVTIQSQILDLILEMQAETGMSVLLITHDFPVIAEVCKKVIVMYAGKIVEISDVKNLFSNPLHPYTSGLIKSIPKINSKTRQKLYSIPGYVPSPSDYPVGCRFAPRCGSVMEICKQRQPRLISIDSNRKAACFLYEN
ncbi:MAG TPA: ABC transporter ATP-binding protein [bacterium]|nr:ABC transporter ATP-binding protein [bacterium]HPN32232.1 ABC transporter ATP-binding protein [bacterium]